MSWMKRPQGGAAPPKPEHPGYAAPASQPYGNQQNMFPNYQGVPAGQPQQMWQIPQQQQQYNQQYGQVYQQQPYPNNTSQHFQQPQQYNQNYINQNYDNSQQGFQQNYYQSQAPQVQNFTQSEGNTDGWEENWNWGWEDSSKQQQKAVASNQVPTQPQHYNNANVLEESFVSTNTWNWSMEDKKVPDVQPSNINPSDENHQNQTTHIDNSNNDFNITSEPCNQRRTSNVSAQEVPEQVKNFNDKEVIKEHVPNLALGKRFHLENLTPQWSIESQMSQDSSDGPQTLSEGTYRSENQSRNSSKGSPGPNTDKSNLNYSHSGFNETSLTNSEWSKQSIDESPAVSLQNNNRKESYDELANSVQEMTMASNDNSVQGMHHSSQSVERVIENKQQLMGSMSSTSPILDSNKFIPQQSSLPPPPPVSSVQIPPTSIVNSSPPNNTPLQLPINPPPPTSLMPVPNLPPFSSALPISPPTNFPTSVGQNPFKSSNPFAHKNVTKVATSNPQSLPPQIPGAGLASPTVVNKVIQQERHGPSYGANLETTPDNSERPDQPQVLNYRQLPINSQIPDNLEVAPQNDRNEYLQTAHLSIVDYGENTDFSGNIAPPGLRRMGVGQQELEYNQNLNISGDEPPPGLARMVPGQQTESDNAYSQRDDDYIDRQIDGQPTDISGRPYRQAEGQQTSDSFTQPAVNRNTERRPVGLDRMVPGEPSIEEFSQYQPTSYNGSNDQRVVTGVDHEYTLSAEVGPTDIREQNVDGSDYSEPAVRNTQRSIIGLEVSNTSTPDFSVSVDDQQREITMEGENLQDLSLVSSTEISFPREAASYDGINLCTMETGKDRSHDADDVAEYAANSSRRQSLNRVTSGEDSERDRTFKTSPRADREKQKSSRDRDRERDKDRGRYSRSDRKYDRDPDRRSGRDERRGDKERRDRDRDRRNRDESPEPRRQRRSMRSHRYETEDTDYYSDKDRERRQYREGSYTSSKPPRGEERSRRRPGTVDRERRYEDDRSRRGHTRDGRDARDGRDTRDGRDMRDGRDTREERDTRDPARFERRYRAIDPRKINVRRRERDRDDDDRKKETYSSGSRAGSREATDEEPTRRRDDRRRHRHQYDGYPPVEMAGGAGREAQRRQYEYYEHLRRTDPAAYMRLYKRLTDPRYVHAYYDGYGYGYARDDRGSVHSGRSSEAGLKHGDTYDRRARDANSLRTDFSDRELTTDMSLNLQLEESTARSERMTPFKFSTQHVKCCVGASLVAVARGREARVQLLPLAALARGPLRDQLDGYPGPLVAGVTHKKSVVEYCERRAREASAGEGDGLGANDVIGAAMLWELLALMLRQNGVVVGSDIAELLMKNTKQFEYKVPSSKNTDCASSLCEDELEGDAPRPTEEPLLVPEERNEPVVDEREALDKFREYLIYGNRQEALEWAMRCGLWAHALQLALAGERRARAAVAARFQDALPPADPLRTLYAALAGRPPPALACISDERWGDWRPHAAILLSNASARPDRDRGNITQLGDTLNARGLIYSAQFCYLSAGVPFAVHPLAPLTTAAAFPAAPPRLSLLLADPRATTLQHFATNRAIFATEIYEYALSLSQQYVMHELVVYKLVLSTRLTDAGASERALRYAEQAARALTAGSGEGAGSTRALAHAVATLADRLKYFDPTLHDEPEGAGEAAVEAEGVEPGSGGGGSEEPSPRHQQWLRDITALAGQHTTEVSQTSSPQPASVYQNTQYSWADQTLQHQPQVNVPQQYPDPVEEAPDYAAQYYQQQQQQQQQLQQQYTEPEPQPYDQYGASYDEPAQSYVDPYWQGDSQYGYNDGEALRPTITMPGARSPPPQEDRDTDSPKPGGKEVKTGEAGAGGAASGGAGGLAVDKKGSGWLSGVLSKLTLRAPNQMILPDDTNPTIVWDAENKRWRDTASGDLAEHAGPPPPPPTGPLLPAVPTPGLTASTPLSSPILPPGNMFKMQKGRHIKKSYVDVLNPGGAPSGPTVAPPGPPPNAPGAPPGPPPAYFIPAPVQHQGGIYDPMQLADDDYRTGI